MSESDEESKISTDSPSHETNENLKMDSVGATKQPIVAEPEHSERIIESASIDSFAGFQTFYSNNQDKNIISTTLEERPEDEEEDGSSKGEIPSSYLSSLLKMTSSSVAVGGNMLARQAAAFAISKQPQDDSNPDSDAIQDNSPDEDEDAFILATLDERTAHSRRATAESISPILGKSDNTTNWFNELQAGFRSARDSFLGNHTEEEGTNWDFWGKVINDYEGMIRSHPRQFQKNLRKGLPEPIRGMMWQLMSNSKNEQLEEEYLALLQRSSRNEKIIIRDLARTFPGHPYFKDPKGPGQTSLFNILKAYSLYDQEIGYCQGLPFVVGPLILNMPEEQAFCVLVKLMFDYDFRDLYTPKMIGLQLRNHQFDRLLSEQFPVVYKHLENQDIKSTMYASQWFMTLFAYRFPLELVYRIMDVILAEGAESVLRFALALIKRNAEKICTLDFEPLLEYLKDGLFDTYIDNMDQIVVDAATISISKKRLNKWSAEYLDLIRQQSPEVLEADAAKRENRRLVNIQKSLERNYEILNREHIDLVNNFIEERGKYELEREKNEDLLEQVTSLKSILSTDRAYAEEQVKKEMDMLAQKNLQLTQINTMLEDTITELEQKLVKARQAIAESENEKEDLRVKMHRLTRQQQNNKLW